MKLMRSQIECKECNRKECNRKGPKPYYISWPSLKILQNVTYYSNAVIGHMFLLYKGFTA